MEMVSITRVSRRRPSFDLPQAALAAVVFLAVLQMIIVVRFAWYLQRYGDFTLTVGTEELNIYALAKQQAGLPLYQPVDRMPYSLVPYNFAFYKIYGLFVDLLGAHREAILVEARWLTLSFAIGAVVLFCSCARFMLADYEKLARLEIAAILGAASLVFLGFNFSSSWSWTLRPDLAAVMFELAGLFVLIRWWSEDGALYTTSLSGVLFATAWGFKQSDIWIFFSIAAWLAWGAIRSLASRSWPRQRVTRLLLFCGPMIVTIVAAFWRCGPDYTYNTIQAQSINALNFTTFKSFTLPSVVANTFFFVFFPVALALRFWWRSPVLVQRPLQTLWLSAFLMVGFANVLESFREGSGKNHLLEFFTVASLLAIVSLIRLARAADRRRMLGGALALVTLTPLAVVSVVMLAAPNTVGTQIPATAQSLDADRRLLAWYEAQPGPRFSTYGPLSLPWFSNGDRYPQFIMMDIYFERALELGLLPPDYLQRAIGPAKTVVLGVTTLGVGVRDAVAGRLRAAGYKDIPAAEVAKSFDLLVLRRDD